MRPSVPSFIAGLVIVAGAAACGSRSRAPSDATSAPGGIEGVVTDAATGTPVAGVFVAADITDPGAGYPPANLRDTTDAQGRFEFASVRQGSYDVTATYNGFVGARTGAFVSDGKTTTVNFALRSLTGGYLRKP